jgi:transcriptional regulator with XRE-family HTH domain
VSAALEGLPFKASRSLKKLGHDLNMARRRRSISTQSMCDRAFMSRPTLAKIEAGDPTVSMGLYLAVMTVLGMEERLSSLASTERDTAGLALQNAKLPRRITRKPDEMMT